MDCTDSDNGSSTSSGPGYMRARNWDDDESIALLQSSYATRNDSKAQSDARPLSNDETNKAIAKAMLEVGYNRTAKQVGKKIQKLRGDYRDLIKKHELTSGAEPCTDPRYPFMKQAFGTSALHNPGKASDSLRKERTPKRKRVEPAAEADEEEEPDSSDQEKSTLSPQMQGPKEDRFTIKNNRRRSGGLEQLCKGIDERSKLMLDNQKKTIALAESRTQGHTIVQGKLCDLLDNANKVCIALHEEAPLRVQCQKLDLEERLLRIKLQKRRLQDLGESPVVGQGSDATVELQGSADDDVNLAEDIPETESVYVQQQMVVQIDTNDVMRFQTIDIGEGSNFVLSHQTLPSVVALPPKEPTASTSTVLGSTTKAAPGGAEGKPMSAMARLFNSKLP